MHVDLRKARKAKSARALRRADDRFVPSKALAGTVRYLRFAKRKLGRTDLAIASYHMGVGNLQRALSLYGASDIPYAQLYFDSTPLNHARRGGCSTASATTRPRTSGGSSRPSG